MNPSLGLAPNSSALLTHPSLPGNPPVVAIREVGEGRSMAMTTDASWFWRFVAVGQGSAGREYDRFWSSALRWLIRDPDLDRLRLRVDPAVALLGEPVRVHVEALGPDYRPLVGAEVLVELVRISGEPEAPLPEALTVRTGGEGTAVSRFEAVPPGTYVVRAEASHDGLEVGTAKEPLIVEAADVELQAPFPRPQILEALAEGSGGKFVTVDEALPSIDIEDTRRVEVDRSRRVPIWNTLPMFLVLLLLAGAEWWWRRRSGLL